MSAPCTQEVARSAHSLGNPRTDRLHHLGDVRVQSLGVCTQSVMSTVVIRSNLMGCQRTDHGCTKWCRRGDRKSACRTRRPSTFECTWYSCTHTVSAVCSRRALSFWIIPVRPMTSTWFWGSQTGYPRWWQRMEMHARHVHISVQLLASLLHFIIASVSTLMVSTVQIQMMDCLNEGLSLHTMCICTFCAWLNPAKVCGSVLVWNTCTICIFLRRLHRSTSDGLLMVAQRKGALNIHCILARSMHIWDQHMYAPELYCQTFSAEPASGLGQSSTADQPWIAHGGNFPRTSKYPFPRTSKWAMSKDLWIGISGNFH